MKSNIKEKVIEVLKQSGFVDDGCISETTMRIGSNSAGYAPIHYPARVRLILKDTNWKVTVGAQTTCFYNVVDGKPKSFTNIKTKSIDDIEAFLKGLVG